MSDQKKLIINQGNPKPFANSELEEQLLGFRGRKTNNVDSLIKSLRRDGPNKGIFDAIDEFFDAVDKNDENNKR